MNVPNGDGSASAFNANAVKGFQDFFTNQGGIAGDPDTCADSTAGCHTLPLTAGTNSSTLNGFDIPTMRGLTDRFLQFSLGITFVRALELVANVGLSPPAALGARRPNSRSAGRRPRGRARSATFGAAFLLFEPVYDGATARHLADVRGGEHRLLGRAGAPGAAEHAHHAPVDRSPRPTR